VLLVLLLTGGMVDLDSAYQQRVLIKLGLVALLLSLAAVNKLRLTPLLQRDYARGAARLRTSIRMEIAVAALILCASAWLVATAPDA
jgi:putative copper export protein